MVVGLIVAVEVFVGKMTSVDVSEGAKVEVGLRNCRFDKNEQPVEKKNTTITKYRVSLFEG